MPADQVKGTRPQPPFGAIIVFIAAALFYGVMGAALSDTHNPQVDAFGQGLAGFYGFVFGVVLWLLLGVLLVIGWARGEMPNWAAISAFALLPLSALAATIAAGAERGAPEWLQLVPMLLPPPLAAYALWARLRPLHRLLPPNPTATVLLGIVLALTLAPLPHFAATQARQAADTRHEQAERQAAKSAEDARRAEDRARFDKLTDASPLWEWAAFFGKNGELDQEAIVGARKLPHRQADAEEALRRGMGFPLIEYARLDLTMTPGLCAAAGDFLRADAAAHRASGGDADYLTVQTYFEPYDRAIEWLTQDRCDIDAAVAVIRDTVGGYRQSSSRDAYLAVLAWRRGNGFFKRDDDDRALAEYDEAIRLEADNAQFLKSRGDVYFDKTQYDRAIADYDAAVRLNAGYPEAYYSRGNAYDQKGDEDQAIANFDEAIRRAPEFAAAYNNRANVYVRAGKLDLAVQDYDAALRLAPRFRLALANRGRARFYQAAYPEAAADLAAALPLKPTDAYTVLWLYLARAHAGQPAREALRGDAAKLDRSAWPWPIVAALLGDEAAKAVIAAAGADANPDRKGQECEADFYFGVNDAVAGDTGSARDLLQRAATGCPTDYFERTGAGYELARLP